MNLNNNDFENTKDNIQDTSVNINDYADVSNNRNKKKSDLLVKVLSVLASVVLWFYVVGIESPYEEKVFHDIPITLTDLPENSSLSVISGYDTAVSVTISGRRSDLSRINATEIIPYIDLSGVTHAGEIPLSISVKPISGVSVVSVNPGMVYTYVDKTITKSIPVEVDYTGGTTDKNIIIDEIIPSLKSITVTGPAETVDKVAGAVVYLDIGFVDRSFEVRERVSLVDAERKVITNPYITMSQSELKVTVNINKYKTVPIRLKTSGVVDTENIKYTIEPTEVTIKGEASAVDAIEYIETELVDETKVDGEAVYQLKLSLPRNVDVTLETETVKADISLKNNSSKVVTLISGNIFPTNENTRYNVVLNTDFLNINLRGDTAELSKYKVNQIYAQYDVSAVSDVGIVKLPVKITLPNADKIYVSGDYYIEVESKSIKK